MIARKMTLDKDDDEEGEEGDSDTDDEERVEAPREIPSEREWNSRPRRREIAELC